ncbi:MAG: DUF2917 domain-containing protein [Xanthobacteraceae bacterium]
MTPRPNPLPRQLRPRAVLNIRDGRGLTVRCLAGWLWITQYGDSDDHVLEAGECFVLDRPGLALVIAPSGPATVVVVEKATRGLQARRQRPSITLLPRADPCTAAGK